MTIYHHYRHALPQRKKKSVRTQNAAPSNGKPDISRYTPGRENGPYMGGTRLII